MLMTIDVGNTNITVGIFDKQKLVGNFRLTTGMTRTSDEFGTAIGEILRYNDIEKQDISDAIIASVVPKIMHSLTSGIIKYFEVHPILVEPGVRTGVKIITENPRQIGADRIVNAAGALGLYGGPAIVIDYGTATTYDLVSAEGAYVSGVIAPGIRSSCRGTLVKDGKTTGDRDPQTGAYPGKGDDFLHAGGPGLWTDRSDGIYRKTYDRRIRLRGYQGRSDRWAGQSDLQGNGLYQYL